MIRRKIEKEKIKQTSSVFSQDTVKNNQILFGIGNVTLFKYQNTKYL